MLATVINFSTSTKTIYISARRIVYFGTAPKETRLETFDQRHRFSINLQSLDFGSRLLKQPDVYSSSPESAYL